MWTRRPAASPPVLPDYPTQFKVPAVPVKLARFRASCVPGETAIFLDIFKDWLKQELESLLTELESCPSTVAEWNSSETGRARLWTFPEDQVIFLIRTAMLVSFVSYTDVKTNILRKLSDALLEGLGRRITVQYFEYAPELYRMDCEFGLLSTGGPRFRSSYLGPVNQEPVFIPRVRCELDSSYPDYSVEDEQTGWAETNEEGTKRMKLDPCPDRMYE